MRCYVLILLTFFLLVGCVPRGLCVNLPRGSLIYTEGGDTLYQLNFQTLKLDKIYENPQLISNVSKINDESVLLDIYFGSVIQRLNLKTKQTVVLHHGYGAVFMAKYNGYFFFDKKTSKEPYYLYFSTLGGKQFTAIITSVEYPYEIVPISDDEIVFVKNNDQSRNNLWKYDMRTKHLFPVSNVQCTYPLLWVTHMKKLLCEYHDRGKYDSNKIITKLILGSLTGTGINEINISKPNLYIFNTNQIVYSYASDFEGQSYIGIYDLNTGLREKIIKRTFIRSGIFLKEKSVM